MERERESEIKNECGSESSTQKMTIEPIDLIAAHEEHLELGTSWNRCQKAV
jgi:hypothetical protein